MSAISEKLARIFPSENTAAAESASTHAHDGRPDARALFSNFRMSLPLFFVWLMLLIFGFIMMFSSSYGTSFVKSSAAIYARYEKNRVPGEESPVGVIPDADATQLARHQARLSGGAVLLSLGIALFLPFRQLTRRRLRILVWGMVTVFLVACRLLSAPINGARRWLEIGSFSFQPSELAKIALIYILAGYFASRAAMRKKEERLRADMHNAGKEAKDRSTRQPRRQTLWREAFRDVTFPVCVAFLWIALVIIQPHLSGAIILFLITVVMFFLSGVPRKSMLVGVVQVLCILLVCALLFLVIYPYATGQSAIAMIEERFAYAGRRISTFQNTDAVSADDSMQVNQAEIALGSGGVTGKGFGTSVQKLNWLSEAHNDFILSIIGEELGFVGVFLVVALFLLFLVFGLSVAKRAASPMARLAAAGYTVFIVMQAFLNMAVAVGLIPATGVSLPFFSYGGTSNIFFCLAVGLLLCISKSATEGNAELLRILGKDGRRRSVRGGRAGAEPSRRGTRSSAGEGPVSGMKITLQR